jgi:hypothetical protein
LLHRLSSFAPTNLGRDKSRLVSGFWFRFQLAAQANQVVPSPRRVIHTCHIGKCDDWHKRAWRARLNDHVAGALKQRDADADLDGEGGQEE